MKVLTKKSQDEILKRIADCQIICETYSLDFKDYDKITQNFAHIVYEIGGADGITKVLDMVHKLRYDEIEKHNE